MMPGMSRNAVFWEIAATPRSEPGSVSRTFESNEDRQLDLFARTIGSPEVLIVTINDTVVKKRAAIS